MRKRKEIEKPPAQLPKQKAVRLTRPKSNPKDSKKQATILELARIEDPQITSDQLAIRLKMSDTDISKMRGFLIEYMRDFSEFNAAMRMGYPEASAASTGKLHLYNSYTQLRLQELLDRAEHDAMINSSRIIAGLMREANALDVPFSSNSSTRISAWKELAKIKGLTAPKAPEQGPLVRRVMLVPLSENWESEARKSQTALRQSTAIDV